MFEINSSAVDWLTLTTFQQPYAKKFVTFGLRHAGPSVDDAQRMQYRGRVCRREDGTVFWGDAQQQGRTHYMMQVSGMLARDAFAWFAPFIYAGKYRVTRIDVQTTVVRPPTWSQREFFGRLTANGDKRSVSYVESDSGPHGAKLATVYVGSRSSDRVARIYEKPNGETVCLRAEFEYKSRRAGECARLLSEGADVAAVVQWEIARLDDDALSEAIPYDTQQPVIVARKETDTEAWLLETVAPTLARVLNDHNASRRFEIRERFTGILNRLY